MDSKTRKKLEEAGWKVGDTEEFLGLSEDEAAFVAMKLSLAEGLRAIRRKRRLTQTQVARIIQSSQSRVAKMEAADASVTLDLMVKALLTLGAKRREVARILA